MPRAGKALVAIAAVACVCFFVAGRAEGGTKETVLHTFDQQDGAYPFGGLIFDSAGHLYGTTNGGGDSLYGTIFKLVRNVDGTWTHQVLHSFNGNDGQGPYATLLFDKAGNLYGTTQSGGPDNGGVVFELSPGTGGVWTEKILHSFSGKDGYLPSAALIFDTAGNLYGTTIEGGDISACPNSFGCGTVFKLTRGVNGQWTEAVLHAFTAADDCAPSGSLVFDASGNLYSTTYGGSGCGYQWGTVFKLAPSKSGPWVETVLHRFDFRDGANPQAGLIFDVMGNLYSTTWAGGVNGVGTVFKLSATKGGQWTHTILHSFNTVDGYGPVTRVIFDKTGNLYGTTYEGGPSGWGTVYKLSLGPNGQWTETVIHGFSSSDGRTPSSDLVFDSAGSLFGTTGYGGNLNDCGGGGCGAVFEVQP